MQIRCDGATTDVLTPIVQARTDGVHLVLENTTDDELFMQTDTQGEGVPPGETSMGLPILPGSAPFRCLPVTDDLDTGVEGGWARFDVLAPGGWVSPDVDCPGAGYGGVVDYKEGARGVADPLQDAPKHFREDGEVVQAGYATDEERTFVLLRDGEPVAGLVYVSDGHGGWLRSESFGCSD
ncbi:MAG: hypothetical protein K0R20_1544 [Actinomycetia bacterium]|nr:hypothetical protein [Actinomycetes bacterium]